MDILELTMLLHRFRFSYPLALTYLLGAEKSYLIETILLSNHNICFGEKHDFFLHTLY